MPRPSSFRLSLRTATAAVLLSICPIFASPSFTANNQSGIHFVSSPAPQEALTSAKAAFAQQQEQARATLLSRYGEALKTFTNAGRLQDAAKLSEEMKAFEASGVLQGNSAVQKDLADYGRAVKAARSALAAAYEGAIKALTQAGALTEANELLKERGELALTARVISIALQERRTHFLQHANHLLFARPASNPAERMNAGFELVPGLSEPGAVSFRCSNLPGHYLAHGNFRLRATRPDGSDGARQNATFRQVKGLGSPSGVSFESINHPGRFLRVRSASGEVWIDKNDGTAAFRTEATFLITEPQFPLW